PAFVSRSLHDALPISLAAPFLVSMGVKKLDAVCIALLGHAIGVSFGAVGTPVLAQAGALPFSELEIARATAIYHAMLGSLMAFADRKSTRLNSSHVKI